MESCAQKSDFPVRQSDNAFVLGWAGTPGPSATINKQFLAEGWADFLGV